jgi:cytochrome c553
MADIAAYYGAQKIGCLMHKALFVLAALSFAVTSHAAGVAAEGQKKSAVCAACHGADGNTPTGPDFPRIGGQHIDYLAKALGDYKSGARKNPIMGGQAQNLSVQDIQDLAAYFSSRQGELHIVPISRFKSSGH